MYAIADNVVIADEGKAPSTRHPLFISPLTVKGKEDDGDDVTAATGSRRWELGKCFDLYGSNLPDEVSSSNLLSALNGARILLYFEGDFPMLLWKLLKRKSYTLSRLRRKQTLKPILHPSFAPVPSPIDTAPVAVPASSPIRRRRGHHRHARPHVAAPSPLKEPGIGSILSSSISSASGSLVSSMAPCMLSVRAFGLAELERATDKFSSRKILGEGGFGHVYKGITEDGSKVAVKLLTRDHHNGDREFIAEVEMLSRLHHRNLVKLIGICIEGRSRCLVYELVHNGSVESHLHGAARGLAYLHEDSNPRVIHRDFKASNVSLEHDFTLKVSDFGLAREATEGSQHISTRVMGTFGYVAPEYAMTGHLLVKSDVYSYGVVLLELITGRKPVDMSQPQGQENLVTWARPLLTTREGLEQLVDTALAGTYDFDDMAKVAAIASMCVHLEVTHRPFMGEVVQALKLIYNDSDETCGDYCSQKDSSIPDSEFKGELAPSESSWWNNPGGATPRLTYGHASSFITMEYSSGPLEDVENRPLSDSGFNADALSLPMRHRNRSGPQRTMRSKPAFY
ncbi:hypothetical protein CDL15_Pgr009983 [Punica granatum]|uniref:Protein kinase domain-containing protein n=2 Tax=Punica granatum TaxID=22663 RepID=A0A218X437_PUNGR|nr:hypothetical protein CDL15_Pgr009983 [Punica granatum]